MKINLNSISFKLLLAYISGVVLSISLIIAISLYLFLYQITYIVGLDVRELTRKHSTKLEFDNSGYPVGFDIDDEHIGWIYDSLQHEIAYRLLDISGKTVFTSPAGVRFWEVNELVWRGSPNYFTFDKDGNKYHAASRTILRDGQTWYLQFAMSARFYYLIHKGLALPRMIFGIVFFSIILLFVFGACAYISLRWTLKPLRRVSDSASAISPSSIHARLDVTDVPAEIKPIVSSFNNVLNRLENGYRIQQDFISTAAHELKTPLALIRAQIESDTSIKKRPQLLMDVEHMTRQVQQLLLLAEVSELQNYKLENIHVLTVVEDVMTFLQPMADVNLVRVYIEKKSDPNWLADQAAFFVLIKNLIENAIQHVPKDSQIKITVNSNSIKIRDFGSGIEDKNLGKIFNRFWRGAHRRDIGAGLGLSICQEISQAHDWKISVSNENPGVEFSVSIT